MSDTKTKTSRQKTSGLAKCLILVGIIIGIECWFLGDAVLCALENQKSDDIRNYFLIFVASGGAPFLVWRAIIASRNTEIADRNAKTAKLNAETASHEAATNRSDNITRAYSTAIDQLGSTNSNGDTYTENIEIRLGAIYTLEKIALSNEDYHQSIIEVLASYVRHNSPNIHENIYEYVFNKSDKDNSKISIVIQTILTVIARRRAEFDTENTRIDLTYCNLKGLQLGNANLKGAWLWYSDLSYAVLKGRGSDLSYASLNKTDLTGANLSDVDLTTADLTNIKVSKTTELPKGFQDIVRRWSFHEESDLSEEMMNLVMNKQTQSNKTG